MYRKIIRKKIHELLKTLHIQNIIWQAKESIDNKTLPALYCYFSDIVPNLVTALSKKKNITFTIQILTNINGDLAEIDFLENNSFLIENLFDQNSQLQLPDIVESITYEKERYISVRTEQEETISGLELTFAIVYVQNKVFENMYNQFLRYEVDITNYRKYLENVRA
jgi:hypothetical protein